MQKLSVFAVGAFVVFSSIVMTEMAPAGAVPLASVMVTQDERILAPLVLMRSDGERSLFMYWYKNGERGDRPDRREDRYQEHRQPNLNAGDNVDRHKRPKHDGYSDRHSQKPYDHGRRHRKHRHNALDLHLGLSPYYYDPYYFDDPYYYGYSRPHKLSCNAVQRSLRRQGYRNVRAYDCRGSQYGFYATRNHKRYKVIVNSRSGQIVRRVRQ